MSNGQHPHFIAYTKILSHCRSTMTRNIQLGVKIEISFYIKGIREKKKWL